MCKGSAGCRTAVRSVEALRPEGLHPMRLPVRTPSVGSSAWKQIASSSPALVDAGCYLGPLMGGHTFYPTVCNPHAGPCPWTGPVYCAQTRANLTLVDETGSHQGPYVATGVKVVGRNGDRWYCVWRMQDADGITLSLVASAPHVPGSDPRLPPAGKGWINEGDKSRADICFSVAPGFSRAVINAQVWTPSRHRTFAEPVRKWVVNVLMCARLHKHRRAGRAIDTGRDTRRSARLRRATVALPDLPVEMWFFILSLVLVDEMVSTGAA